MLVVGYTLALRCVWFAASIASLDSAPFLSWSGGWLVPVFHCQPDCWLAWVIPGVWRPCRDSRLCNVRFSSCLDFAAVIYLGCKLQSFSTRILRCLNKSLTIRSQFWFNAVSHVNLAHNTFSYRRSPIEDKTVCVLDIALSRVSVDTLHNLSLVSC